MSNWPAWLPLRGDLSDLTPYGAPQITDVTSLNTNENPFALPKAVVEAILTKLPSTLESLNRYPDRDALSLRTELSRYINKKNGTNFNLANIWAANGSNEILQTLVLACGHKGVLGFITTPNNPSGNAIGIDQISKLAESAKSVGALLVVDEAYAEFSTELSAVNLIEKFENLVVVRTMSKAFALAGARVGYFIANPKVVEVALITRLPYHLSSQTQEIAIIALQHDELLQAEIDLLISERKRVSSELIKLGMKVVDSEANFLLFTGFKGSPKEVWSSLLDSKVLIRDVGIPNHLRTTIGTPDENNQFLAAIAEHRP